ncbi:hypothetical protein OHT76_22935 [Streptomyces sp. NBC_00287]|uniref:hypothetical protein n=1 Tax=Streptomyces sp. NBC_00287 TaxID=2975702 RepID=UPI002E2B3F4B|nr:hypothetical protein [Streptomyces sp. NBC_00287]
MTDQSPDLRSEAEGPHYARSKRRRHAVPRTSALTRLRLPLGKALVLTALPTVLVLASQRPPGADASATAAHSAPEGAPGGGVDCARPDDTAPPAVAPTPSVAPSTPSALTSGESVKPSEHVADEETGLTPAPAASPSATAGTTGLADILGSLFRGDTEQQSPAPGTSPSASLAAPTPTTTEAPDAPPTAPHASSTPGHRTTEPSPQPEPTTGASRICDISDLKAPEDKSAGRFAAESWNMKGSRLELRDLVFGGVVTVDTAAGPKRVLKFSAATVTIRDLKMAVPVGPQIQHIDGAPGSTSTLRGDDITMYVESLAGTLSGVEGIPLSPALRLHLTPDTVPEWLYDTLGKLGLKLQLGLDDADIDQAGQTGGELVIPGIHGYGTPP